MVHCPWATQKCACGCLSSVPRKQSLRCGSLYDTGGRRAHRRILWGSYRSRMGQGACQAKRCFQKCCLGPVPQGMQTEWHHAVGPFWWTWSHHLQWPTSPGKEPPTASAIVGMYSHCINRNVFHNVIWGTMVWLSSSLLAKNTKLLMLELNDVYF